jgi:hypothetical protein
MLRNFLKKIMRKLLCNIILSIPVVAAEKRTARRETRRRGQQRQRRWAYKRWCDTCSWAANGLYQAWLAGNEDETTQDGHPLFYWLRLAKSLCRDPITALLHYVSMARGACSLRITPYGHANGQIIRESVNLYFQFAIWMRIECWIDYAS